MRELRMKLCRGMMAGYLVAAVLIAGTWTMVAARTPQDVKKQEKEPAKAAATDRPVVGTAIDAANPKDVQSLDAIVAAIYDVISGPPGARDWNRFNSLFAQDARLIAVRAPKDGKPSLVVMTPASYAERGGKYFLEHGFFEHELSRKTDSYGAMTHIYTTYESRETKDGKPEVLRFLRPSKAGPCKS